MRRLFSRLAKMLPGALILLTLAGGVVHWQREPVLSWYYLRNLAGAEEGDRSHWAERVASLDAAVLPGLMDLLRRDDAMVCANGEAALSALAKRWGSADARSAALAGDLASQFTSLSMPGREAVLEWYLAVLNPLDEKNPAARSLTATAGVLLTTAAKAEEKGVRLRTMVLAEVLLGKNAAPVDLCRDLAVRGMDSKDAAICARAIRLVMHAPLHAEKGLLDRVVPFLKDASPQVRCAAVLTVGLAEETIAVQEMLPLLQDSDAEVRRLCEAALRGRGLQDTHIKLAKLITDERAGQRLKVVQYLNEASDLDPGIWLMHLSQDPSPAVRAAAIRFAGEDPAAADFQQRMQQMAREDASATVRQLAAFYLKAYQRH